MAFRLCYLYPLTVAIAVIDLEFDSTVNYFDVRLGRCDWVCAANDSYAVSGAVVVAAAVDVAVVVVDDVADLLQHEQPLLPPWPF